MKSRLKTPCWQLQTALADSSRRSNRLRESRKRCEISSILACQKLTTRRGSQHPVSDQPLFQNLGEGPTMAKYTQREVDPQRHALSRRRFLRNAGIGAVSLPFLGSLADTANAESSTPTKNQLPSYH